MLAIKRCSDEPTVSVASHTLPADDDEEKEEILELGDKPSASTAAVAPAAAKKSIEKPKKSIENPAKKSIEKSKKSIEKPATKLDDDTPRKTRHTDGSPHPRRLIPNFGAALTVKEKASAYEEMSRAKQVDTPPHKVAKGDKEKRASCRRSSRRLSGLASLRHTRLTRLSLRKSRRLSSTVASVKQQPVSYACLFLIVLN